MVVISVTSETNLTVVQVLPGNHSAGLDVVFELNGSFFVRPPQSRDFTNAGGDVDRCAGFSILKDHRPLDTKGWVLVLVAKLMFGEPSREYWKQGRSERVTSSSYSKQSFRDQS